MSEQKTFTLDEIEQRTGFDKRTIAYYVQQGLLPKVGRRGPKTRYPQLFMDRLQFVNLIRKKQDLGEVGSLTLSDIRDILNQVSAETIAGVVAGEDSLRKVEKIVKLEPLVSTAPQNDQRPLVTPGEVRPSALAEEAAEITEALMEPADDPAPSIPDLNRRVRMGLMDANSASPPAAVRDVRTTQAAVPAPPGRPHAAASGDGIRPPRRFEDEIKKRDELKTKTPPPVVEKKETAEEETAPPSIEIERLGWFLARLQRAMTGDRRRKTGTTESWHRALVTPELTISARNLKDDDAYLLDAVARLLKKLLWEAWED